MSNKTYDTWACKYFTIDGKKHLGLFNFHGTIIGAEKELEDIIPEPYTKAIVLGHVGTFDVAMYRNDGFSWIKY